MKKSPLLAILVVVWALAHVLSPIRATAQLLYVSNASNDQILRIGSGGAGTTFATTAGAGINSPYGLAFDTAGNLFVANNGDFTILRLAPDGVSTVFATNARNAPISGLAFDTAGNLYAANNAFAAVLKYAPNGSVTTFATAGLSSPTGLAFDSSGNLFVADNNNTIMKFAPDGSGTVFANTMLNRPVGLAFDSSGNLFVANYSDGKIIKFTSAGVGTLFYQTIYFPYGMTIDSANNLFVAHGTFEILRITPSAIGTVFANNASAGVSAPTYLAFTPLVIQPPFGFRVTESKRIGNDLRLSFTTLSGFQYAIQSCADLAIGAWVTIPGTTVAGTGGVVQETIVNAFVGPTPFFRVVQL